MTALVRICAIGAVVMLVLLAAEAATPGPTPVRTVAATTAASVAYRTRPTPRVAAGARTHQGAEAQVACATCHSGRTPDLGNRSGADLDLFHQGLQVAHGMNSCLSCHDPGNYDQLHLADGRAVPFSEAMTLCSQCHGTQRRSYDHGAHGGMNGSWDHASGTRTRNTCTSCHDPHVPKYQGAIPMPPPRDRFQHQDAHHE
jgi:hypothetical protein